MLLKYTIQERLPNPATNRKEYCQALEELRLRLGLGYDAFYAVRKAPIGSKKSATGDQLLIMADFFGCTMEELYTELPEGMASEA